MIFTARSAPVDLSEAWLYKNWESVYEGQGALCWETIFEVSELKVRDLLI